MKPPRSRAYLDFVRSQPCAVPGCSSGWWVTEACHTGGHGIAQKASDFRAVPLCIPHHRGGNEALDKLGPRKFQELHGVDIPAVIRQLHLEAGEKLVPMQFREAA